jgi:predicted TPR repeat methyltransferase
MENGKRASETQDVKKFFDGYAADFDSIYGHTDGRGFFDKLTDKLFRQSMSSRFNETLKFSANPEIKSILDVGCGPGHYCLAFLMQGKNVAGLDVAAAMLDIAKKKTASYSKEGKISFILDGYMEHQFSERFDAACLMGFFDYIQNPEEIFLKLKKDVNKEFYMSFPKKGGLLAIQRKIRYNLRNCPLYLYSKEDLTKLLEKTGLSGKSQIIDLGRDYFVKVRL